MNKKNIIRIIIVIAIAAVIFILIAALKKAEAPTTAVQNQADTTGAKQAQEQPIVSQSSGDSGIDAIEKEINSLDDSDFSESDLSDQNLGL